MKMVRGIYEEHIHKYLSQDGSYHHHLLIQNEATRVYESIYQSLFWLLHPEKIFQILLIVV